MITNQFPWLTAIILLPIIASIAIPFIPDKEGKRVRVYALSVGIADFLLMCYAFWQQYSLGDANQFQLAEKYTWIPQLGLSWAVSVDGLSAPLVLLAGFVTTLSILAAWQVDRKPKMFYFLILLLYSAQIGVFAAQDMLLFFIMWELELVPVYLLVSIWGGAKRRYAATKFILYTAAASIFILIAGLAMALYGDNFTFDIAALNLKDFPLALEIPLYAGLLIAFGVKLAIFPLHTWLPDAHGEASAPISMILAGVLLKMGGYGLIRFNLELLPDAHVYFAPILIVLGVVNIIYGGFTSFGQSNMKRRLAYSSVSHMGFVLLGIASFTDIGISGAMLQMLSHGLIAAVLFFLTGVTYDRTHTLFMDKMDGIGQVMPKVFALFTIGAMASLALPGMSGFASEIAVFVGIATSDIYNVGFRTVIIILAAVGVIMTPIYLLSMIRLVFFNSNEALSCEIDTSVKNNSNEPAVCFGNSCVLPEEATFNDASYREIFIAASFLVMIIGIGLYPKLATQMYDVKTVAVNAEVLQSHTKIAESNPGIYAQTLSVPRIVEPEIATVLK